MATKRTHRLALIASTSALALGTALSTPVLAQQKPPGFFDKMSKSVSDGTSKITNAIKPKTKTSSEPLVAPNKKAGCSTFVAMARIAEQSDKFDEAEANYKKALEIDKSNLQALVGFAHLEDRRNNFEAAEKLYQTAVKKHPKEASVRNDQGLCYHRHAMLPEAAKALEKAVSLKKDNKLYRNNLAAVYVEQGKNKEALAQLVAAHGEAVANYNLAFLLTQKQDNATALVHFRAAAEKDPSLTAAHDWVARLSGKAPSQAAVNQAIADVRRVPPVPMASRPPQAPAAIPVAPNSSRPADYAQAHAAEPVYQAQRVSPAAAPRVQYPQQPQGGYYGTGEAVPPLPGTNR